MEPNTLCIVMFQAIIEPLVVAEVEPMVLQLPLQIPVSFGDKAESRIVFLHSSDDVIPILGWRTLPCTTCPGPFEDLIQQEHCHVAADAVTLSRDARHSFNDCLA